MTLIQRKAERTQIDGKQDEYSQATGLDTGTERGARQEFKDEADVNIIMRRYGADAPLKPTSYGEQDFDLDLQQALASIDSAQRMFAKLPSNIQEKYQSWQNVLNAAANGGLAADLNDEKQKVAAARQRRIQELDEEDLIQNERARNKKRADFEKNIDNPPTPKETPKE
jgi:hypothetical protein